jgi:lysozyme family protein
MKQNYQYALTNMLADEGGYTNNKNDAGGATNYGITIADYRLYINSKGTADDVKNMTVDQAKLIYKTKYWDKVKGDTLPAGVDYCVFDYGVNSGIARAQKILQKFSQISDPVAKINAICDERLAFLQSIRGGSDWVHFGKGWSRRVANVRAKSIKLATMPVKAPGKAAGALVGTAGTGAAGAVITHWWTPITDFISHNWYWMTGLTAMICIASFIGYTVYKYRKSQSL